MNEQLENLKWLVENLPDINENMSFLITELEEIQKAFDESDSDYIDLIKENKRYREALEEIRGLYPLRNVGYKISEIRKIVIKALEGEE